MVLVGICEVCADDSSTTETVAIVQPFVSETTCLVLKADPRQIGLPDLADALESMSAESKAGHQTWVQQAEQQLQLLRSATDGQSVYATIGIPVSETQWSTFAFLENTPQTDVAPLLERLNVDRQREMCIRDGVLVVTPLRGKDVKAMLDRARPHLAHTFQTPLRQLSAIPFRYCCCHLNTWVERSRS